MPTFFAERLWHRLAVLAFVAAYFFIGYLSINAWTASVPVHHLDARWDALIPYVPSMILPYLSGYAVVAIVFFAIPEWAFYLNAMRALVTVMTISFLVFLLFPVEVTRPTLTSASVFQPLVAMVHGVDRPYNAFPSLHVSLAFTMAFAVSMFDRRHRWMIVWAAAIAVSALLVKQHTLADVVAGFALSWVVCRWVFRDGVFFSKTKQP